MKPIQIALSSVFVASLLYAALADEPPVRIKGSVVDASGAPVKGATVQVHTPENAAMLIAGEAPVTKKFVATNGTFEVEVGNMASIVGYVEGLAPDWRTLFGLENGQEEGIKLVLTKPSVLAGVVVDEKGKPLQDAEVFVSEALIRATQDGQSSTHSLSGKFLSERFKARTDQEGRFRIEGFPSNATAVLEGKAKTRVTPSRGTAPRLSMSLPWRAGQEDIRLEMEPSGSLEGKVVVEGVSGPLRDATVSIQPKSMFIIRGAAGPKTAVGADGSFRIADVAPGAYSARVEFGTNSFGPYAAEPVTVVIESGQTAKADISASTGGVVEVTVLDKASQKPVPNTTLYFYIQNVSFNGRSGNDGKAVLRLPPKTYQVLGLTSNGQTDNASVTVEAGQTNTVELLAPSPLKIKGVVRRPDGTPAKGIQVMWLASWRGQVKPFKTDEKGNFEMTVSARPQSISGLSSVLARDPENNLAAATELEDDMETIELKLEPATKITGRVESGGAALEDAAVALVFWIGNSGTQLPNLTRRTGPGSFEIPALPQGNKYGLSVSAAGHGVKQVTLGTGSNQAIIEAGTIELKKADMQLAGKVVDADDKPLAGISVRIFGENQPADETQSDKQGRFVFKQVCEGPARLMAFSSDGNGNATAQGGDTNVIVQLGKRGSFFSSSDTQRRLRGVITDAEGKPVSGAKVAVFPSNFGSGEWATSKEAGVYDIRWSMQPWQLDQGGDPLLIARLPERNLAVAQSFNAETTNLDVQLKPAWIIKGKVEDAAGKPLAKSKIILRVSAGRTSSNLEARDVIADAQGGFEIKTVPSGPRYNIEASANGYGRVSRSLESDKESGEVVVEPFVLKLADQVIAGQVLDTNGKPASTAAIQIIGNDQPQVYEHTDKNGRFKFNVCEGEVRLYANGNNSYGDVVASAGDTNVVIQLQDYSSGIRRVAQRPALKGKPLPDCSALGFAAGAIPAGKPVLLCLVDSEQRPSRRAARVLGERHEELRGKGLCVACVQAVPSEDAAFSEWTNSAALPFSVGRVTGKNNAAAWVTSVKSLPWLVLADAKGIVIEEGFALDELDDKVAKLK